MTAKKRFHRQGTFMLKKEEAHPNWLILDAAGKTLGRFASEVAKILRGKHKPTFTPHTDGGDGVIVINADQIVVTGAKHARKVYYRHTGNIGGLRAVRYSTMHERNPEYIIERAVKGMMPRTRLGRKQLRRLRIHVGEGHYQQAQQPLKVNI